MKMTPHQHMTVLRHEPSVLELDATWHPGGKRPPRQIHPTQSEQFELLAGELTVAIDGQEHTYRAGEHFEIPTAAVHGVWNAGAEPARAIWRTLPAGRTLELFENIDGLYRTGAVEPEEMPSVLVWATLLTEYRDVLQLGAKPAGVIRGIFAMLARTGRKRGYLPRTPVLQAR